MRGALVANHDVNSSHNDASTTASVTRQLTHPVAAEGVVMHRPALLYRADAQPAPGGPADLTWRSQRRWKGQRDLNVSDHAGHLVADLRCLVVASATGVRQLVVALNGVKGFGVAAHTTGSTSTYQRASWLLTHVAGAIPRGTRPGMADATGPRHGRRSFTAYRVIVAAMVGISAMAITMLTSLALAGRRSSETNP
jgi:hypothetical protein